MLTPEQELFLANFADKGIASNIAEQERIAKSDAESKAFIEKQEFVMNLNAQKAQEVIDAIAAYEAKG